MDLVSQFTKLFPTQAFYNENIKLRQAEKYHRPFCPRGPKTFYRQSCAVRLLAELELWRPLTAMTSSLVLYDSRQDGLNYPPARFLNVAGRLATDEQLEVKMDRSYLLLSS